MTIDEQFAIPFVFALLLFLYAGVRMAIAVLIQPQLATCAVSVGLWVTGAELHTSSNRDDHYYRCRR